MGPQDFDPAWKPPISKDAAFDERTWLAGLVLIAVGYGIVFTLFSITFMLLVRTIKRDNFRTKIFWLSYIVLLFVFGSLYLGSGAAMTQLSFVDYRLYPGGPSRFEIDMFSIPVDMIGNVAFVLANWMADGVVVWRCTVIYQDCRISPWIVKGVPVSMYLLTVAMGIFWLIQVSHPGASPWSSQIITNFTAPYFGISLALNVTMTVAIVLRLLVYRWRISSILGPQFGVQYTGLTSMLVESAFIYTAGSLLFIIPFVLNHSIQHTFVQALGEIQIIAPLLIIFRVASGHAWTVDTSNKLNAMTSPTINFIPPLSPGSTMASVPGSEQTTINEEEKETASMSDQCCSRIVTHHETV